MIQTHSMTPSSRFSYRYPSIVIEPLVGSCISRIAKPLESLDIKLRTSLSLALITLYKIPNRILKVLMVLVSLFVVFTVQLLKSEVSAY